MARISRGISFLVKGSLKEEEDLLHIAHRWPRETENFQIQAHRSVSLRINLMDYAASITKPGCLSNHQMGFASHSMQSVKSHSKRL